MLGYNILIHSDEATPHTRSGRGKEALSGLDVVAGDRLCAGSKRRCCDERVIAIVIQAPEERSAPEFPFRFRPRGAVDHFLAPPVRRYPAQNIGESLYV